jgi:hypothetical protein
MDAMGEEEGGSLAREGKWKTGNEVRDFGLQTLFDGYF